MVPKIFNFKKFVKKSGKRLPITFDKKFPITVKRIFNKEKKFISKNGKWISHVDL